MAERLNAAVLKTVLSKGNGGSNPSLSAKKKLNTKIMAKLRKYEYINDIHVYEVDLTEDQLNLYNEDEDKFWDEHGIDLDWEFQFDKVGDPEEEIELIEE
jgi:hypothetical protein